MYIIIKDPLLKIPTYFLKKHCYTSPSYSMTIRVKVPVHLSRFLLELNFAEQVFCNIIIFRWKFEKENERGHSL